MVVKIICRSLLQETYELLDCLKYDKGTTADHNDIWELLYFTLTRGSEYSTLTEPSISNGNAYVSIPNPCKIEFDICQVNGATTNFFLNFYDSSKTYRGGTGLDYAQGSVGTWISLEIELNGATATVKDKTDGTTHTRTLKNSDTSIMSFFGGGDITELRFKNFKVYPI